MTGARAALVAGILMATGTTLAGCGGHPAATPGSADARRALEASMLRIIDGNGIPVQDDHVACSPDEDGRSDTCYALTSDEPVKEIRGSFKTTASAAGPSPTGCPGTLSITVGPPTADLTTNSPIHPLATAAEDPCR